MSDQTATIDSEPLTHVMNGLRDALAGLAIGLVALGLLFHAEIAFAINTWIESTAYNHCFLVIPIAIFLIWDRRATLRGLTAVPLPIAALLALPLGAVWLVAERLGIMEGRQLVAISIVEVLLLAMLGWRLYMAVLGPLLYLYFLVPFGEFLTPKLQDVTTWFIRHGVDILGVPAYIDGYIIDIPEGSFFVAEACAGLRFLIASIAFGVLYALLMYRSPWRRAAFIGVSIVVPIIANGFRALGIVYLGHLLGSAEAAVADHILYGWIFFSVVILMLIVLGLPFREDNPSSDAATVPVSEPPRRLPSGAARQGILAGLAVAAMACFGPAVVMALNEASAAPNVALKPLDLSPGCVPVPEPAVRTTVDASAGPGRAIVQRMNCGGTEIDVHVEVFSPRSTAAPINAERRRVTRPQDADDFTEAPLSTPAGVTLAPWRLIRANLPAYVSVVGLWVDGKPTVPGMAMRLGMARSSLAGGSLAPVLVALTPVADWANVDMKHKIALEQLLASVIKAHPGIGDQVMEIAKAAR